MSPEQLQQFKQALIDAADRHIAEGGKVVSGRFAGGNNKRCPMGCLLPEINEPMFQILTKRLGFEITDREVWDFVFGFDGSKGLTDLGLTDAESPAYLLGRELHTKYIKE